MSRAWPSRPPTRSAPCGAGRNLAGCTGARRSAGPPPAYWTLAGALLALYGAWPGRLWGDPHDLGQFSLGLVWQPPNTDPEIYYRYGDRPWFAEYHWHGIELLTGNAFLLGGLALLALLIAAATRTRLTTSPPRRTTPLPPRYPRCPCHPPTGPELPATTTGPKSPATPTGPKSPATPTGPIPPAPRAHPPLQAQVPR